MFLVLLPKTLPTSKARKQHFSWIFRHKHNDIDFTILSAVWGSSDEQVAQDSNFNSNKRTHVDGNRATLAACLLSEGSYKRQMYWPEDDQEHIEHEVLPSMLQSQCKRGSQSTCHQFLVTFSHSTTRHVCLVKTYPSHEKRMKQHVSVCKCKGSSGHWLLQSES